MEGLDLLKKDWQKERNFPKITESEIYAMLHKKSSSIVKWILIISVLEIAFWIGLNILLSDEKQKEMVNLYHLDTFMTVTSIIHWTVLVIFVFVFYKNFRNISNISSTKSLMSSILSVRKIVQYYVWYNVIVTFLIFVAVWISMFFYDENLSKVFQKATDSGTEIGVWFGVGLSLIIMAFLICGFLWLFYRVIYGILLRRLYKNYKELEKIEL